MKKVLIKRRVEFCFKESLFLKRSLLETVRVFFSSLTGNVSLPSAAVGQGTALLGGVRSRKFNLFLS